MNWSEGAIHLSMRRFLRGQGWLLVAWGIAGRIQTMNFIRL